MIIHQSETVQLIRSWLASLDLPMYFSRGFVMTRWLSPALWTEYAVAAEVLAHETKTAPG